MSSVGEFGIAYLIFLFSTTLHEYGHARVGQIFGSRFAEHEGLVTLDPIPHIRRSPVGMVLMPIISVYFFHWLWPLGWASVPYDPSWANRHPRQMAFMSAAGPAANFLLAIVAFALIKGLVLSGALVPSAMAQLGFAPADGNTRSSLGALAFGLPVMMYLNITLGIFNMLPIPPLDGASVCEGFFPRRLGPLYSKIQETPAIGWILFLLAFNYASYLIWPVLRIVTRAVM